MGKKQKDKKKGKGAEKTTQKTEKKLATKLKKELQLIGEDDIEKIVAQIEKDEKKRLKTNEIQIQTPSRRLNFSFIPHPDKDQLIMFGGEFFDGKKTSVYNDLLIYNIPTNIWTVVQAPGAPPPRCGHQMIATSANGGQLWLFGGEFTSPSQSQFYHYSDLWVYHLSKKQWEKINVPNGPSARSGHRMVLIKKKIFLFGGFHDNLRQYKYFNDVYTFDIDSYQWVKLDVVGQTPIPRSSCIMVPLNDGRILIYGGYSKETIKKDVDKGHVHTDSYILGPDKHDPLKWKWQNAKIGGHRFPPRCSISSALVANNLSVLCYGGVFDTEDDDENLTGKFFNDFLQLDVQNMAWRNISLSGPKSKEKEIADDTEPSEEMEVETNPQPIENTTVSDDGIFKVTVGPAISVVNNSAAGQDKVELFQPCPRINCGLAIKKGLLFLYGGMFEKGDKQITLNDFYSIDVRKFDEWRTILKDDQYELSWVGSDSEEENEDSESDDSNSEDDSESD